MFKAIRDRLAREDEGFTLIELLVVVIIIGILAAIAIPTFLNQRKRGWDAALTSDVRNSALDIEAEGTAAGGAYPAAYTTWTKSAPTGVTQTMTYTVSTNKTQFCVVGDRTDLGTAVKVVYASHKGGMQAKTVTACPAFDAGA